VAAAPGARAGLLTVVVLAWCWAVEVLQLAAVPDGVASRIAVSRLSSVPGSAP